MGAQSNSIPQQRVVEKLDEYMSHRDYAGAERHLLYWLAEAIALGDARGELMIRNELVGHFRKTGERDRAFAQAREALRLVGELEMGASISAGTTYTNIATAYNAFGEHGRSLELFRQALGLYEKSPHTQAQLIGGLYNNMALTCVALQDFDEADGLYRKALATMATVENGELEQAITYLNMADAAVARAIAASAAQRGAAAGSAPEASPKGASASVPLEGGAVEGSVSDEGVPSDDAVGGGLPEFAGSAPTAASREDAIAGHDVPEADFPLDALDGAALALQDPQVEETVERCLDTALQLLDTPSVPRDGYYAFVCEKCAPTFAFYGYFLADEDLRRRAQEIYERD